MSDRPPRLTLQAATFALMVSAISPAVSTLHREATLVDLHSDTLLDVASGKRDISRRGTAGHIDLPRLREGGVDVQVFAAFIHPREAERGLARALDLIDAFDRMVSSHADVLGRALTFEDIEQLGRSGKVAAVLSIESGDAVQGNPANVDRLYRRGVRIMSLTWNNSTALADGALEQRHRGLTPVGRRVLARMAALGIIVDVSHLSEKSFWDVLEATRGPVVATHSNAAGLTPHVRNLTDEQLRALARRGGVVGVNYYPAFTGGPTLNHVLAHIDYLVKIVGAEHVALGSDFDGFTQTVDGLEDVSRLPNLTAGLLARGYSRDDIKKVLGGNALRVFREVWRK